MFVTNWISTTKIQKISEITNFFRHYFLSRTEVVTGRHSGRQCRKAECAYPSIRRYGFIFAQFRHRFPEYGIEYGNRAEYRTHQCRRFHTNGGYRFFLFQEQWRRTSCGHQFDCRNQRSGSCPCLFCNEAFSEHIHRCA